MEKIQYNYREMSEAQFADFVATFNKTHVPREHKPDADGAHFVVYNYGTGGGRYSLHYDRKAKAMQVTAVESVLQEVALSLREACISVVADAKKKGVWLVQATKLKPIAEQESQTKKPKKAKKEKQSSARADKQAKKDVALEKTREEKKPQESERSKASEEKDAYRDGYSLAKYDRERLEQGLKEIEAHADVARVKREESNPSTPRHTVKITITSQSGDRAIVQYAVKRKVVQIQGRPSALTDCVQSILSESSSEKDIVAARLAYNQTRSPKPKAEPAPKTDAPKAEAKADAPKAKPAKAPKITPKSVAKALDKAIPNGIRYLSKQSQTYLYYAMIDLESNLANYGGILATAYQGLEHLIATLQQSMGINVKMIGQAYEKEGAKYVLKASYRRKVKSIVYAEVMSALYCEYFDKRHFYTHSDNFSDVARIMTEQSAAKAEFDRLIAVIEYNCTKLSEIGFRISDPAVPTTK